MWRIVSRNEIPQFLDSLDLPGVANYIKSDSCKNIFVMAGAGISTSAGIPDFRSPDTGLYANLARLNLPYPEAVFDISFFKRNPRPFYVLAHELAPGKFRPTLTHAFIRLLADKGLLHTCFTQNIDTLERAAGVPSDKIIEAHGSFADQHCVNCGASYPHDKIKKKIVQQEIPICERRGCSGYVKPDIVFFGESLSDRFFHGIRHLRDADLIIVMGTSLTVHPFASLTEMVPEECPRLLINIDHVGGWGSRVNDVACLMPCDRAVRELCRLLGWQEELDALWAETAPPLKKQDLGSQIKDKAITSKVDEKKIAGEVEKTEQEKAQVEDVESEKKKERGDGADDRREKDGKKAEETEGAKGQKEKGAGEQRNQEKKEEERATDSEEWKGEPVEGGKRVSEELLADVVDKLAETIREVRLEDEGKSKREGHAEPASTEESKDAQISPESTVVPEKADNPDVSKSNSPASSATVERSGVSLTSNEILDATSSA